MERTLLYRKARRYPNTPPNLRAYCLVVTGWIHFIDRKRGK